MVHGAVWWLYRVIDVPEWVFERVAFYIKSEVRVFELENYRHKQNTHLSRTKPHEVDKHRVGHLVVVEIIVVIPLGYPAEFGSSLGADRLPFAEFMQLAWPGLLEGFLESPEQSYVVF